MQNQYRPGERFDSIKEPKCQKLMQDSNNDTTRKLMAYKKSLENEIENLTTRKKELNVKADAVREAEKMFCHWSGIELEPCCSENEVNIAFPIFNGGEDHGKFTIGFVKSGANWIVKHHVLPPCMKMTSQRVKDAEIDNQDKLCKMIHQIHFEVEMFSRRQQQFKEAKSLACHMLRFHSSIDTLSVMVEIHVSDMEGSDLSVAYVHLTYRENKFLPEQPIFRFNGGTKEDHKDLIKQLSSLEVLPLRDALTKAFDLEGSGHSVISDDDESEDSKVTSNQHPSNQTTIKSETRSHPVSQSPPRLDSILKLNTHKRGRGRGKQARGRSKKK